MNHWAMIQDDFYTIINGDCIDEIVKVESESVGLSIFSPPFPELYCYSDDERDLGNCKDYDEFKDHFSFLPPELYRIMMPGRNVAIHCMDVPVQKGRHGYIGLRDFSGLILREMEAAGFIYHSRVTIWKNPVTEMQRTKALGLLHKQVKKDATMSRVGIPDYVLIFRKDGERKNPVRCPISVDTWQQYASPVWMDIDYGDTLNAAVAWDERDEKHICPLQLPTIRRLVTLYTNEGDLIFTPFLGIGSELKVALELNRRGIGFELKQSYFEISAKNLKAVTESKKQLTAF
jgi:DNA modification methylase